MNLATVNKRLEIFWWFLAIVTLIMVIIMSFVQGFDKWKWWFFIPVIAALMALLRRWMYNKLKNSEAFRDKAKK